MGSTPARPPERRVQRAGSPAEFPVCCMSHHVMAMLISNTGLRDFPYDFPNSNRDPVNRCPINGALLKEPLLLGPHS